MSTLMNTITLYEHKVLHKTIAIIPRNLDSRIFLEKNLSIMTENLYIAGFRWDAPPRKIDIITKNELTIISPTMYNKRSRKSRSH